MGWRAARGRLIAFTDDDCRPAADWLELMLAAEAGPATFLQGRTVADPDEYHLLHGFARSMEVERFDPWAPTCNIAYPRALLERIDGFDESFPDAWGEDTDMALRAIEAGAEQHFIEEAVVRHAVLPRRLGQALSDTVRRSTIHIVVARHPQQRQALDMALFTKRRHAFLLLLARGPAVRAPAAAAGARGCDPLPALVQPGTAMDAATGRLVARGVPATPLAARLDDGRRDGAILGPSPDSGALMRIALLAPTYWPEVTRGSERVVHDLAVLLAERGHDVTLLTSHPGATTVAEEEGVRVVRDRRPPRLDRMRFYEDHVETTPALFARLAAGRFDVAAAFHNASAWAAVRARRVGGPPVAFCYHGLPTRFYLVERRYRIELMRAAITGAAATTVLSEAAAVADAPLAAVRAAGAPGRNLHRALRCREGRAAATRRSSAPRASAIRASVPTCCSRPSAGCASASRRAPAGRRDAGSGPEPPSDRAARRERSGRSPQPALRPIGSRTSTPARPRACCQRSARPRGWSCSSRSPRGRLRSRLDLGRVRRRSTRTRSAASSNPTTRIPWWTRSRSALKLGTDPATAAACRDRAAAYDWSARIGPYEETARGGRGNRAASRASAYGAS